MNADPQTGRRAMAGFTLMEVVVSIGILAVSLTTIAGTIGYSSRRAAESSRRIQAAWLLDGMIAETAAAVRGRQLESAIHRIEPPANTPAEEELFFTSEGSRVEKPEDAFFRCRLEFRADATSAELVHLQGRVTWPAVARDGREQGSVDLLTSILKR